ncbi:MAG: phosphatase PAP2-related protein [Candidatus Pacebacteria bacterium]|nr:phosphatase PAP2-related protein [Candidatus Paceibacterota bacterium]
MRYTREHIMKAIAGKYKHCMQSKGFIFSVVLSLIFLVASLFINFYAGTYAAEKASSPVTDIILSNTRAYDLDGIFIYGPLYLWGVVVVLLAVYFPQKIPFTLKSIALFVVIRSLFITLTHIGPFPAHAILNVSPQSVIYDFTFGGDLFFSAHTGLPFLMALVFWKEKYLRYLFIASSIFFGIVVLLAHLHYTIDVLSAFFITYTINHIAQIFFKKDFTLAESTVSVQI